jgi:hypothetical protein
MFAESSLTKRRFVHLGMGGDNLAYQIGYLVGDGHVALLLGNAGDGADVSDLRSRLALDDRERRLGLDNLAKMSENYHILSRIVHTFFPQKMKM